MPYLGNVPAEAYTNTVKDSFNGDGSTTAFTLSQPSTTNNLRVVVENVIQDPTVAYTVSGTTLTFTSAPPTGTANIYAVHLGPAVQTAVPPSEINNATTYTSDLTVQGAFTSQGIDDNATSTAITLDSSGNVGIGTTSPAYTFDLSSTTAGYVSSFKSTGNYAGVIADAGTAGSVGGGYFAPMKGGTRAGVLGTTGAIKAANETNLAVWAETGKQIEFFTNGSTTASAIINTSGNLSFTNGQGIDFSASEGSGASSSLLDDYEEGTWTATAAGTSAIGNTTGYYQKIGDRCFFYWYSEAMTMSSAVNAIIGGLPFTCASGSPNYSAITAQHNTYAPNSTGGYVVVGSSSLDLVVTNQTNRDTTPSSGTKYVMISGHYKVA